MQVQTLKKYWRLFWHFRRLQLMRMMEYRANFIFWTLVTALWGTFNFFFLALMIEVGNGSIASWQRHEMYILIGVFNLSDGLVWSAMYHNMVEYSQQVFRGTLSGLLLKPVNTQFFLMTHVNNYNNFPRLILGFGAIALGLRMGHITPSATQWLLACSLFAVTTLFLYFLWFILTTGSFWVERLNNINEVLPNLQRLWRFPSSIYTGVLSTIFTVALPLGLISTLPAEALLGRLNLGTAAYFTAFTIGLFLLGRWFFHVSLRQYASVGD